MGGGGVVFGGCPVLPQAQRRSFPSSKPSLLGVRAFLAITAHVGFLLRIFHAIKVTPFD
jgi:hypothetical protein